MNYILIDGLAIYVFLILIIALVIIGITGLWASISSDIKLSELKDELYGEREKNIFLNRDNMRLKLKCGELKVGEKVDV